MLELSAASDFHFAAAACVCELDSCLGRLGKLFIHFFLVGEQLLDARALPNAFEMRDDMGKPKMSTSNWVARRRWVRACCDSGQLGVKLFVIYGRH